ncbi:MAG: glycosyltransferase [Actinomycetota bacterium]|nr:glycosyltransferase [Actinomycetota bacterium]
MGGRSPDRNLAQGEALAKGYVFAAAGTAGHIYPAVAVAEALLERGVDPSAVSFVTSRRKVEQEIFSTLPYPRIDLDVSGVRGRNPVRLAQSLWRLAASTLRLRASFSQTHPAAVVVFGGYISLAAAVAARSLWIPIVVVETNSVMGRANRFASRLATRTFRSFEEDRPGSGVPLRAPVISFKPDLAMRRELVASLGFDPDRVQRLVSVFGGSLGSRRINEAAVRMLEEDAAGATGEGTLYFVVLGRRDEAEFSPRLDRLATEGKIKVVARGYEERLYAFMACSDAVVCRAGSNTVAELDFFGVPAVLVPLPGSPGDHQTKNASWLAGRGAAVMLGDAGCDATSLRRALGELGRKAASFETRQVGAAWEREADSAAEVADYLGGHFAG